MDDQGAVERWLDRPFINLTGLSVRPEGTGPWRAVLVDRGHGKVYEVDGKGAVKRLPGSEPLRQPVDAVIGLDGAVYLCTLEPGCIWRIQDGSATMLAGADASGRDGQDVQDPLGAPESITQDPRTGDLIVADGPCRIRRVSLRGELRTIAGSRCQGFELWQQFPRRRNACRSAIR